MSYCTIQEATQLDIEQLNTLYSEYLLHQKAEHLRLGLPQDDYSEIESNHELLKIFLSRNDYRVSIAKQSNNLLGFGIGRIINQKPNLQGIIEDLMVIPAKRELGVGKKLFDDLKLWFISSGCRDISLSTYWGTEAIDFYKKLGLSPVGVNFNYKL